jgi:hypothetical protein
MKKWIRLQLITITNYGYLMADPVHLTWVGLELTMLAVIGIDCIGSDKSNYYMITTTTTPSEFQMTSIDCISFHLYYFFCKHYIILGITHLHCQ